MYIITTASADTYITNKIIDGRRTEDANVGRAGTLDLFKLYDETVSGSSGGHYELSRLLVKFDLSRLVSLSSGTFNVNSNDFNAKIRLQSVDTNLPTPRDFTVSVFPLAKSFDEGDGRDVSAFTDIDASNYLSSSTGILWSMSGAYATGAVGDSGIDYYASGNLQDGLGLRSLESTQRFEIGNEDLLVDVTDIISASIGNVMSNNGFIIAFTSSQETDTTSRFVKRFASRHVTQHALRPRLEVSFNDSIFDSHAAAYFDSSGSLYLRNFVGSSARNLLSASLQVAGHNCLQIILSTGSYSNIITASQESIGDFFKTGSYFGEFYISAQDQSPVSGISGSIKLADHITASGSIVFNETWKSLDGNVTYLSTFLTCSTTNVESFNAVPNQIVIKATNSQPKYYKDSSYKVRVFAYDPYYEPSVVRVPKPTKSLFPETYYRIRDIEGAIYVPFDRDRSSTRLSTDENGMFFNFLTDGLPEGKLLTIDYLVIDRGNEYIVEDKNTKFTVGS